MTENITVTTTVNIDDKVYEYLGQGETLNKARFLSEKKARALLRRRGLSVKMKNVIKKRCPDCPERTNITVYDLDNVPKQEVDELDDYDWLLSPSWSM